MALVSHIPKVRCPNFPVERNTQNIDVMSVNKKSFPQYSRFVNGRLSIIRNFGKWTVVNSGYELLEGGPAVGAELVKHFLFRKRNRKMG